jgi:hypothetical protein
MLRAVKAINKGKKRERWRISYRWHGKKLTWSTGRHGMVTISLALGSHTLQALCGAGQKANLVGARQPQSLHISLGKDVDVTSWGAGFVAVDTAAPARGTSCTLPKALAKDLCNMSWDLVVVGVVDNGGKHSTAQYREREAMMRC